MSDQAVGSNSRIIFGVEDSLGAGAAVPNGVLLYYKGGETFGADSAETDSNTLSDNPNPKESFAGQTTVKGGFQFELAYQYALLLAAHCGSIITSAAVGGVFTEVFKIGKISKSLWFEKGLTDLETPQFFGTTGHRIPKYSYSKKSTGAIDCSFDIPGLKDVPLATASIDTTPVDLGHHPFDAKGGTILIDGEDVGVITAAKFDSSRNAKPSDPVIGSGGYSSQLPVGKGTVKGTVTALFSDVVLYKKARARDTVAIKLADQVGTGDGTAGNECIEHFFPETHLSRTDPTIKDDTGIMVDFPFTAFNKNDAGGSAMVVTIKHSSTVLHGLIATLA
jgi:hypothetical protein